MPITPAPSAPPMADEAVEEAATAVLDAAILNGQDVEVGDRIELEVVSVDPESGEVVVKYPEPVAEDDMSIASASKAYDEPERT